MSLPGNGIFVVQGEMSMLVTAMRRSTRWGSHSFPNEEYDVLMRTFQDLKTILNQVDDLRLLDPATYLSPFLEVIRSKETTGPVTSLALSAIHKFLSYGLIDPTHPSVPATVEDIADAVTHARFVGTDHSSDGVVLMKILQVLRTLMLSPEGAMLTDESVCEIMLSCFRICFETRLTELLRRNAEQCLRDMTQLIFMRLPQFPPEDSATNTFSTVGLSLKKRERTGKKKTLTSANSQTSLERKSSITEQTNISVVDSDASKIENIKHSQDKNLLNEAEITIEPVDAIKSPKKHGRHSSMDLANGNTSITQLLEKCVGGEGAGEEKGEDKQEAEEEVKEESVPEQLEPDGVTTSKSQTDIEEESVEATIDTEKQKLEEYVNHRGIRFTAQQEGVTLQPYGLACVRELFRFLISLCNPLDTQNTSAMVHLGLSLVGTALEVAADHLAACPSLLYLVKDPLCRNLLSLLSTERISIFALDLQVTFLLFEALRFHLKFQIEAFFKKIIEIISADTTKAIYELKEIHHLAIESIIQLFRIPGFCTELYLNYDCDVYCMNTFEEVTKLLSKNVVSSTAYNIHSLSLEALLTIIEAIETGGQIKEEVKSEIEISNDEGEKETRYGRGGHVTLELGGLDDASVVSDHVTHDISQYVGGGRAGRHKPSTDLPTEAELDNVKNMKMWVTQGTELFNQKPEKGIEFLQEHGVLATPLDPHEVAIFLRENPDLDKKMIGEYICKRSSRGGEDEEGSGCSILGAFADSFDYTGLRIDQALRLYLETFRLPGEAPLIFLVMERFAERWHSTNGEPVANTDAAFKLAYAVIMLNMDQHNHNAKKLNVPMTVEDFVKNLRGCNDSGDFDKNMLEQIFHAIKNEEMVMPAERVGAVREAYLWRVLQRRGAGTLGVYRSPAHHHHTHHYLVARLFSLACPPAVTALSAAFERAAPPTPEEVESGSTGGGGGALLALAGLERCAALLARTPVEVLSMDTLLLTLCKFTGLLAPAHPNYIAIGVALGQSLKAQAALRRGCGVWTRHAHTARQAWRHLLEILKTLYVGRLLPKCLVEAEDYLTPNGTVSLIREAARGSEAGLLSSLYSYIALGESGIRAPTPHEKALIDAATECVAKCNFPGLLITETKFLPVESLQELIRAMVSAGAPPDSDSLQLNPQLEDIVIFFLELLGQTLIQNRDRLPTVWEEAGPHIRRVVVWSSTRCSEVLTRALTSLLRTSARLMRCDQCAAPVLHHLTLLFHLPYKLFYQQADVISCGVYELVKTSAQNVHSACEWDVVFALLCAAGAGAWPDRTPGQTYTSTTSSRSEGSEDESDRRPTSVSSESELSHSPQTQGWILVKNESGGGVGWEGACEWVVSGVRLRAHRDSALSRCAEALSLVVRDVAHVTPYNCRAAVRAVRIFAAATAHRGKKPGKTRDGRKSRPSSARRRGYDESSDEETDTLDQYHMVSIQLLDLMHTLHSRTAQIFKWWRDEAEQRTEEYDLWDVAWKPLLQGIATFCTDRRKQVANSAIAYLQRALLVPGLSAMGGAGWEACFHSVLFPLLEQLPRRADTAARANTIMCKVFLQHLSALSGRATFPAVWTRVVGVQRGLVAASGDDALTEAALESLKNMILVMDSVRIFSNSNGDGYNDLWYLTWEKIGEFLPNLKEELFPQAQDIIKPPSNLPSHMQPSLPSNLPTLVPLGPSTPTILPQPRPIQVQTSMTQSPIFGQMSPVNLSQTPPTSNTPTLVAPTPVSGMVPIRNPLYDQTGLTSSVLLQPLNEMISTPIGVSLQSQIPILYPQATMPPPPKPEPVTPEQHVKIDNQLSTSSPTRITEHHIPTVPLTQNIEHHMSIVTPPQNVDHDLSQTLPNQNIDYQISIQNIEHQISTSPLTEQYSEQNNVIETNIVSNTPENVQQSELYAEYLTNPYNDNKLSTKEATLYEPSSIKNPLLTIIDKKSYSENTTPMHSNKTHFGSTDNVRQESSIFNFSSYFGSSQGMGGSEVFDTLMSTQEG